ncbi:MBL fold metallo-hydrolase [Sinorhizobium sp. CCBAU 05631]|uniref:MBL fold metallo-hydrolase n=1 Tax=Sinorhizobium sp. CCBAU 05631 TaxID=794846 RepID=UPI0004AD69C0|nr:MBL fold metallo-hydrolase [Sinorhizobium sp. CCBAU 05631]
MMTTRTEIRNERKQHAVGQGFFHSGTLLHDGAVKLRYVYDCGAMKKHSAALKRSIASLLADVGGDRRLELLFISHSHADHVSGLPILLDAKKGMSVDTIILPLFNVMDRLIEFAKCASHDPAVRGDEFYREFVVDPVTALSRFNPRQIMLISSGGPGDPDGPSFDRGPEFRGPVVAGLEHDAARSLWKLSGSGNVDAVQEAENRVVARMTDHVAVVASPVPSGSISWLFSPYIDPAVSAKSARFQTELLKSLNQGLTAGARIKKAKFQVWLDNPLNLKDLVVNKVHELVQAFNAVSADLNTTSMCLYSGPLPDERGHTGHHGTFGRWSVNGNDRVAWLATGDADLKSGSRRKPFLRHYRRLTSKVSTLTLPHHGSENNFDVELLTAIEPVHFVAAADRFSKWRHPGTGVLQAVASHGRFLSVVTSQSASEVTEVALLRR